MNTQADLNDTHEQLAHGMADSFAVSRSRSQHVSMLLHERAMIDERIAATGARIAALREAREQPVDIAVAAPAGPQPITADDRSQNKLRPQSFAEVVGQTEAKEMMGRVIESARERGHTLDHTLMVGPAGTGKTTLANVIANELGRECYQLAAPVDLGTLLELRDVMNDGDILFIDEIHQQAIAERRTKEAASSPEVFLQLLEDDVLATGQGMLPFPDVTIIGATTDPGRLPDPFLDRFPLQPRLRLYSADELTGIATDNARSLDLTLMDGVAEMFAGAARGTPRIVNNYMKNAASLVGRDGYVNDLIAMQVLHTLNGVSIDGLTREMQGTLTFLATRCRREAKDGTVTYQGSVNTIATAIGLSRDTKAVQLRVEPYLIQQGYLQVTHGGRMLTDAGLARAQQLATEVQA